MKGGKYYKSFTYNRIFVVFFVIFIFVFLRKIIGILKQYCFCINRKFTIFLSNTLYAIIIEINNSQILNKKFRKKLLIFWCKIHGYWQLCRRHAICNYGVWNIFSDCFISPLCSLKFTRYLILVNPSVFASTNGTFF